MNGSVLSGETRQPLQTAARSATMRAAFYSRTGPAREVLAVGDLQRPEPGAGEVLVRVATSGVNPSDVKSRGAQYGARMAHALIVPHSDGAGVIDAVGAGLGVERIGQRVWLYDAQFGRSSGTAAEYVSVPAAQAEPLPDNVDFAAGACFGIPFRTAHRAVTLGGPLQGKSVLVQGGAGAVGHYAVQIAKALGARVIATVSNAAKAEHARNAGADHVILYPEGDVPAQVAALTGGRGADHVVEVDLTRNGVMLPDIVAPGGSVAVYGSAEFDATIPATRLRVRGVTMHFFRIYGLAPALHRQMVAELNAMLAAGQMISAVGARFPLSRIADAHDAVAQGSVIGNVVVEL